MDATRTDWPDWRLNSLSLEVERLQKELADMREQEWKKRARRTELVGQVLFLLVWAYLVATVVLAIVSPS
jgi:hypothetical protein